MILATLRVLLHRHSSFQSQYHRTLKTDNLQLTGIVAMTPEQREHTMRAVIAWGESHLGPEERVGYIDRGHKAGDVCDDPEETPLNWQDQT